MKVDYDCTSECLMSFAKGDEWIIYGTFSRFNQVLVNICSHTRKKINEASQDFYAVQSGKSFDQEEALLLSSLGIQPFAAHNELNDQQTEMRPHNDQPASLTKLLLLCASLVVMVIIYIGSKRIKKDGK